MTLAVALCVVSFRPNSERGTRNCFSLGKPARVLLIQASCPLHNLRDASPFRTAIRIGAGAQDPEEKVRE
jgi:hypothetical protein